MGAEWGAAVCSLPVTHTDVQVLQEELQQTRTQAQRPHPLVAPRGLDPRAQVLGKMGVSHRCPGGSPGGRSRCTVGGQWPCQGHPSKFRGHIRVGHHSCSSSCPAGLDHTHGPQVDPEQAGPTRDGCSQGGRQHGHHLPNRRLDGPDDQKLTSEAPAGSLGPSTRR